MDLVSSLTPQCCWQFDDRKDIEKKYTSEQREQLKIWLKTFTDLNFTSKL
jgi:hypothetical protein